MPLTSNSGPEAREWLLSNKSAYCFAGNRFDSKTEAVAFVEQLYAAGAPRVFIPEDSISRNPAEIKEHGGPYADSLVIELPEEKRSDLFLIFEREAENEGYEEMKGEDSVIDGKFLYLWWD